MVYDIKKRMAEALLFYRIIYHGLADRNETAVSPSAGLPKDTNCWCNEIRSMMFT